ncbi:MAG: hypothetical protein IJ343_02720, partial [Clostridia bacterium]|nr:hypothetical protein [Clostridia bacterium]
MTERCEIETCGFLHVHEEVAERLQAAMPAQESLLRLAELFKVFGDGTRVRILYVLLCNVTVIGILDDRTAGELDVHFGSHEDIAQETDDQNQ